jgi:hypothetical protein
MQLHTFSFGEGGSVGPAAVQLECTAGQLVVLVGGTVYCLLSIVLIDRVAITEDNAWKTSPSIS